MNAKFVCTLSCAGVVALSALSACLGPAPTYATEAKPDSSTFTASIDGDPWLGSFSSVTTYGSGYFAIYGTQLQVLNPAAISIFLYNVTGVGTIPLGKANTPLPFGSSTILYGRSGSSWNTPSGDSAGTVTITLFSPQRLAGTFAFTATPAAGFGPNRIVTEGKFDLPVTNSGASIGAVGGDPSDAVTTRSR